ncbi:MAG: hypothetical protein GF334_09550, partial [Candidatus Altiarchaeales archaeon]|nr:hypothetical protein [Candidatus Altiarchaeales archaeon]
MVGSRHSGFSGERWAIDVAGNIGLEEGQHKSWNDQCCSAEAPFADNLLYQCTLSGSWKDGLHEDCFSCQLVRGTSNWRFVPSCIDEGKTACCGTGYWSNSGFCYNPDESMCVSGYERPIEDCNSPFLCPIGSSVCDKNGNGFVDTCCDGYCATGNWIVDSNGDCVFNEYTGEHCTNDCRVAGCPNPTTQECCIGTCIDKNTQQCCGLKADLEENDVCEPVICNGTCCDKNGDGKWQSGECCSASQECSKEYVWDSNQNKCVESGSYVCNECGPSHPCPDGQECCRGECIPDAKECCGFKVGQNDGDPC